MRVKFQIPGVTMSPHPKKKMYYHTKAYDGGKMLAPKYYETWEETSLKYTFYLKFGPNSKRAEFSP